MFSLNSSQSHNQNGAAGILSTNVTNKTFNANNKSINSMCVTATGGNIENYTINSNAPDMDTNHSDEENFNYSNIKVTVGIDEDLQMILEMDPSIVDLSVDIIGCTPANIGQSPCNTPKMYGLPPITGGYVNCFKCLCVENSF